MKSPEVQFTPEDRLILDSYCQMLDGLAQYLGTGYELVLHSLEDLEHSAIRVMNSHTGRSEGAPITELALTMLGRIHAQTQGDTVCYSSTNRDGKPLRSCTIAIRGSEQRIIGLLCINFYMDTPLSQLLETISPRTEPACSGNLCTEFYRNGAGCRTACGSRNRCRRAGGKCTA
mgnify:FL=1